MNDSEKIRAARAAYMRDYARKRRRNSQEMREREKESRDRYWLNSIKGRPQQAAERKM